MASSYVDFDFYTDEYLGNAIAETDFPRLALRASAVIDRITFGRTAETMASDDPDDADTQEKVSFAACAIAEVIQRQESNDGAGAIQSERTGNNSVTYVNNTANDKTREQQQAEAAKLYLAETNLMYKGLDTE